MLRFIQRALPVAIDRLPEALVAQLGRGENLNNKMRQTRSLMLRFIQRAMPMAIDRLL